MPPADTHCGRPHGMQPQYPPRQRTGMPGSPAGPLEFFIASPATPIASPRRAGDGPAPVVESVPGTSEVTPDGIYRTASR